MDKIEVGEIFTINGADEEEMEAEVLAVLTLDGIEYAAVSFLEDLEEDTENDIDVFFLKVDEAGDFEAIKSDEEFERVSAAFNEVLD